MNKEVNCCKQCGDSVDIQHKVWQNINTGEIIEPVDDEEGWCGICEKTINLTNDIEITVEEEINWKVIRHIQFYAKGEVINEDKLKQFFTVRAIADFQKYGYIELVKK